MDVKKQVSIRINNSEGCSKRVVVRRPNNELTTSCNCSSSLTKKQVAQELRRDRKTNFVA